MDVVYNLLLFFLNVRDYVNVEASLILMKVIPDIFHCKCDRFLHLSEVLQLLDLIVWKLILSRAQDAFISKQLLPLLLCNYFLW